MSETMPAIFFGHGNPMNALADNDFTRAWVACGTSIPRPAAVLAISAHWYIPGTFATAMRDPRTIHGAGRHTVGPTPDHYLPLLYTIALQQKEDPVSFPVEGFDGGSVSMLAVQIG